LSKIDTIRATDEADHYLQSTLMPGIRVGVFTSSGENMLNFTGNLAQVHNALMAILPRPAEDSELNGCPLISDLEAYLIAEAHDSVATELAIEAYHRCAHRPGAVEHGRVDRRKLEQDRATVEAIARKYIPLYQAESSRVLAGLQKLADFMVTLPGPRSIVIISPGFLTIDLDAQLDDIFSRAIHSDTIISAIDAGGYTIPPDANDPPPKPSGARNQPLVVDMRQEMELNREAEAIQVLSTFAGNTGGVFVPSVNNLDFALSKADSFPSTYYVLGFWLFSSKFDGKYHNLRVEMVTRRKLNLQSRDGYFAPAATLLPTIKPPATVAHRARSRRPPKRKGHPEAP
jgi:VWFA-related protein